MFESLMCSLWWFLAGLLVGVVLCCISCRFCRRNCAQNGQGQSHQSDKQGAPATTSAAAGMSGTDTVTSTSGTVGMTGTASGLAGPAPSRTRAGLNVISGKINTQEGFAPRATEPPVLDRAAAEAAGLSPRNPQDLCVIEGIGPKTEALLKEHGIADWVTLADTSEDRLKEIIATKEWAVLRMHSTESWAEQAALARDGQWKKLKTLQDELVDGVHMKGV